MKIRNWISTGVIVFFAGGTLALAQDLTITSKTSSDRNPSGTSVSYLSSDHVRIAQGDGREMIVDFKSGQMTTLDNQKKNYYVTTKQDMENFAAAMQERMNRPEMKKAQEQMGAMGGMADSVDVKDTGATRRIAGYPCEVWTLNIGQTLKTEECRTSELQYPVQAWEMYRDFSARMKNMMAAFGPMAKSVEKMQEKFKGMKGYPLSTSTSITIMGHATKTTSEVTDVRKGPIPASVWEVPAGYSKVDNPMAKAFSRSK